MTQMKKVLVEDSNCPRCGETFHCSTSGKCWCAEVDVAPSVLELIDTTFNSCLCPGCLKEVAQSGGVGIKRSDN